MPKLSGSLGFNRRETRSATVASSIAVCRSAGDAGFTISDRLWRGAKQLHVRAERDDGEPVHRRAEHAAFSAR